MNVVHCIYKLFVNTRARIDRDYYYYYVELLKYQEDTMTIVYS